MQVQFLSLQIQKSWPRFFSSVFISLSIYDLYKELQKYQEEKNQIFKDNAKNYIEIWQKKFIENFGQPFTYMINYQSPYTFFYDDINKADKIKLEQIKTNLQEKIDFSIFNIPLFVFNSIFFQRLTLLCQAFYYVTYQKQHIKQILTKQNCDQITIALTSASLLKLILKK